MIDIAPIKMGDKTAIGLRVELPESTAPLILIIGEKGLVGCGFINMEAAEKLNVAVAMVSGVKNFDDMLQAEVKGVTSKAQTLGLQVGIKGKEALKLLL